MAADPESEDSEEEAPEEPKGAMRTFQGGKPITWNAVGETRV